MRSSGIADILRSVRELQQPVRVHGASFPAQALIIARHVFDSRLPIVVLCPDDDAAGTLAADLQTISSTMSAECSFRAFHFPGWEQSPYSPIAPSIRTRFARLSVLSSLSHVDHHTSQGASPCWIITTTLAAACQATLPVETFERFSLRLSVGASVDSREGLAARLLASGYLRVETVEDPGTFAIRGDIVDIFPPQLSQPIRAELFGDELEKIRAFDPSSQRSVASEIKEILIPPAREVLINSSTSPLLRRKLKARADDLSIHRTVRDPLLSAVEGLAYPDHADAWAPYAYEQPGVFFDFLPDATQVVWSDELSAYQVWDDFLKEQQNLSEEAPAAGLILPPTNELFRWLHGIEQRIKDKSRLYLDRIELADLETVKEEQREEAGETVGETTSDLPRPSHRVKIMPPYSGSLSELENKLKLWAKQGFKTLVFASTRSQLDRIRFIVEERGLSPLMQTKPEPGLITLHLGSLSEGFRWATEGFVALTESELLGAKPKARSRQTAESGAKNWSGLQALSDLAPGDCVVHVEHGIGRYQGLVRLDLNGAPSDFLLLEYAQRDKLYLPVYRLNVIQKYVGGSEQAALDRLGSQQFAKTKEKVREAVRKLAIDLVKLYAERKIRPGIRFSGRDALFQEFEAKFPFDETPDQLKAIDDVLHDLESGRVMDRLVCGDVGYGKTEVAIRAAFRAISDGKQVAVLVPTTVLAFQHEQSFRARMKDYPIQIESLSRFKSAKEQKAVLENVANGKADLVIGTHRLLSKDVRFRQLGLVIIDEEHRFGVEHKEKLKALKVDTHVLTLTATPIPRTLHMALSGLRDISLINTPPIDRLPIRTYVSKFEESLIQRAIEFELNRGGQVFFLHNRVQTIQDMADTIRKAVPRAAVDIAHGQLGESVLEERMLAFYEKRTNVLVCTTIIESGLDIPSANTIIINRADLLGLAQLYQIRGRVGRGQQRAYAYLLIPAEATVTGDAKRRLEVIQRFVELGSGFSIASHDLEIRGGGDLLGPQQSGHVEAVGFDLYTELLEEAIHELQGQPLEETSTSAQEPEIKAPFPAFLGEDYVPDIHQRLSLYRRFSATKEDNAVTQLEEELVDRFGPLPLEAQNLLWLIRLKNLLKFAGIISLTVGPEKISLTTGPTNRINTARAIALVSSHPRDFQLTPDSRLIAKVPTASLRDLYFGIEKLLGQLSGANFRVVEN